MPPADGPITTTTTTTTTTTMQQQHGYVVETAYPSRNIAYQAAGMITSIIESLQAFDQLRYAPAFVLVAITCCAAIVANLVSAFIVFSLH